MVIIAVSVILDQVTKYIALTDLKPIGVHPFIPKLLEFRFTLNEGIAWGMLAGKQWIFIPTSLIAIGIVIYIIIRYRKQISPLLCISLAMIAGGGIGNQIDRIFSGAVIDFLNFLFIDFPIFNVADCFVSVGSVLAIFSVLVFDRKLLFDDKNTENNKVCKDKESTK